MSRRWILLRGALALAGVLVGAGPARAWLVTGHARVAADAVRRLPAEMPGFLRAHPGAVGRAAVDPDYWKIGDAPALGEGERPHHYLDFERLAGAPLPPSRVDYLRLLASQKLEIAQVGLLPYSIAEGFERLSLCFAQWREDPEAPDQEAKCRAAAGVLGHYAADLEQPLHTTIHHDGRALPDGETPRSGIHRRVDALFSDAHFDAAAAVANVRARTVADVWKEIVERFARSHAMVDRVYALEPALMAPSRGVDDPDVVAFTAERYRAAAEFLASLYWTAWERSARVDVPAWAVP